MKRVAIVSIVAGALVVAGTPAEAQQDLPPLHVALACSVQVPNAVLTNGFSAPIPAGKKITIKYTQKTTGAFGVPQYVQGTVERFLPNKLPPGQSVQVMLYSPAARPCTASFYAGPADLQIAQVTRGKAAVNVLVRNNNAFIDAPASTTKVRYMKCTQIELTNMVLATPTVPKAGTRLLTFVRAFPPGFQYLDVIANSNYAVLESNTSNNAYTEVGVCIQ